MIKAIREGKIVMVRKKVRLSFYRLKGVLPCKTKAK